MSDRIQLLAGLLCVAALAAGCENGQVTLGRQHELDGAHYLAYEDYLRAAEVNPDDDAAADGLRRTARKAAAFWKQQASRAAERKDWVRAAQCHLKVLQVRPDESDSLAALRRLDREHPDDLEAAHRTATSGKLSDELLAMAGREPAAAGGGEPPKPEPKPERKRKTKARPPASRDKTRSAAGPKGKEPAPEPDVLPESPFKSLPGSTGKPPKGGTGKGKKPPSTAPAKGGAREPAAKPKPAKRPKRAKPEPSSKPARRPPTGGKAVAARRFRPTVRRERGAAKWRFRRVVRVSRDNDRFPKREDLIHGLAVEVRDTDGSPLDADLDVYLGGKRVARFKDVPEEGVLTVLGRSAARCEIVVIDIYDRDETVTLGVRRK